MLDGVLPVAVVDDFRDDDRGSIFGINAFTLGTAGEFPSVSFGSSQNDWELVDIVGISANTNFAPVPRVASVHLFTPIAPYNPATTITPLGFFTPGILPNRSFTFGSVQGIAGTNPLLPGVFGPDIVSPATQIVSSSNTFRMVLHPHGFRVPMRIYRDVTLTVQWNGQVIGGFATALFVSLLYRERPKVSQ